MITVSDFFAGAGCSSTGASQVRDVIVDRLKPVSNRDLLKAAGYAMTAPAARDLVAMCIESLGDAAERAA